FSPAKLLPEFGVTGGRIAGDEVKSGRPSATSPRPRLGRPGPHLALASLLLHPGSRTGPVALPGRPGRDTPSPGPAAAASRPAGIILPAGPRGRQRRLPGRGRVGPARPRRPVTRPGPS